MGNVRHATESDFPALLALGRLMHAEAVLLNHAPFDDEKVSATLAHARWPPTIDDERSMTMQTTDRGERLGQVYGGRNLSELSSAAIEPGIPAVRALLAEAEAELAEGDDALKRRTARPDRRALPAQHAAARAQSVPGETRALVGL